LAYIGRCGVALDMFLNVIFGGAFNQTISLRAAVAASRGSIPGKITCAVLSILVHKDHCALALQHVSTPICAALRAGLLLLLLAASPFIILHWIS
jgi:hypothetical protein